MLLNLHVKNFALIDEIDIDFNEGLNILTGETGAGKSVILGSLNIAMGAKAEKDIIRTGCEFALVEVLFSVDEDTKNSLTDMGVSFEDDTLLVQRKIMTGRNVFKVNGETFNASFVRSVSELLIDVYGQHDYQNLLNSKNHIDIFDSYLGDSFDQSLNDYKNTYKEYLSIKKELDAPLIDDQAREREISLLEYQINEIEEASLKADEEENVETRLKVLENASKIQGSLGTINNLISGEYSSASGSVDEALRELSGISHFDDNLEKLCDTLNSISDMLTDFSREADDLYNEYSPDESELNTLRERYELINDLERKYGRTIEEVLKYHDDKETELKELRDLKDVREKLEKDFDRCKDDMAKKADKISSLRKKATASFNSSIEESLKDLNFNQSKFEVNITDTADYTNMGKDNVKFTISVNPGEALKALESVSSGGELSRIMLALKTVSASSDEVKTMIFDEIDAGISGTTAWQVAKKLALLSKSHQVICITHLQQIASMADAHFKIEKEVTDDERTSTYINLLDKDGEIAEISRMLGDEQASDTFKDNALEIKKRALDYKKTI